MKTSIILLQYNRYDLTHARLMELYHTVPVNSDSVIVVMDDASPELKDGDIKGMKWWQENARPDLPIDCRKNAENLGFGGTCNAGAKTAINTHDADIVVFLSNDVIVRGDFITPIKKIIENNPKSFIGGRVLYYDTGWNTFDFDGKRTVIPYCEGWLLACTSDAWKELGGFDPIFHPYDMEDIDISLMATSLGYDLVGLDLPYLQHISGATIAKVNPNRQAITIRNKQRFYDKWKERWPEILDEMEKAHA